MKTAPLQLGLRIMPRLSVCLMAGCRQKQTPNKKPTLHFSQQDRPDAQDGSRSGSESSTRHTPATINRTAWSRRNAAPSPLVRPLSSHVFAERD